MRKTIFGVIGAGHIARAQHLPNLKWAPHAEVKTVCDLRAETDYRKVLTDSKIEAVVVATQHEQHAPLTMAALEAGKHVYVEKPLGVTLEECESIMELARRTGKRVAAGFNRRFAPAYRKAKELLAGHGGARNITYRPADSYSFEWGVDFPPGYRVFTEVCHIFDLMRWLVEDDPIDVYTVHSRDDDELITVRFKSGPIATIMSSGYATRDMPKEQMEVISEKGAVTIENFVELRTYGFAEAEDRYLFPGRVHPDGDYCYRWMYSTLGAEAMKSVRRSAYWLSEKRKEGTWEDPVEGAIAGEYLDGGHFAHVNYDVDKGWVQAIDHFAERLGAGEAPENASALDGHWAQRMCEASVRSLASGQAEAVEGMSG